MIGLERPPYGGGIEEIRAYLARLTEQLQWALDEIERTRTKGGSGGGAET
ncbi:MAG: hypothetical protein IJU52_08370 [Clostridia bacterium]|nr:hypothetical protein [Clostridia bacterium]